MYFGGIRYAQAVSKTIFQTVLTEVAGYVVFVPKDGTVSGGEIDVEEFLDFPNVVRLKTPTTAITLDGVECFDGLLMGGSEAHGKRSLGRCRIADQ